MEPLSATEMNAIDRAVNRADVARDLTVTVPTDVVRRLVEVAKDYPRMVRVSDDKSIEIRGLQGLVSEMRELIDDLARTPAPTAFGGSK